MSNVLNEASLVMIPSGYKSGKVYSQIPENGDGDLSFTRSNDTATRVNSEGLIEKVRTNLVLQSNTFNTTWSFGGAISLTSGQSGYDGSSDAWLLTKTATGFANIIQSISHSGVHTFSVYAKQGTNTSMILRSLGGTDAYSYFDLSLGTITSNSNIIDSNIESVGNGFYRCSITYNASSNTAIVIYPEYPFGGTNAGNIYIQDAQFEQGLVATDYIPTTTTAVSVGPVANVPRLDYTGGGCPKLLLEPQRTNLIGSSEYFNTSSVWTLNANIQIDDNQDVSPEGVVNASRIYNDTGSDTTIFYGASINLGSAGTYVLSTFAKKGGLNWIRLRCLGFDAGANNNCYFDLENGVKGTNTFDNADIEDYGNGWYRIWVEFTSSTDLIGTCYIYSADADEDVIIPSGASNYISVFGAQLEEGSYPTSYIPTYGAASTRGADACSKTGISSLIGQTEGTLFLDFVLDSVDGGNDFRLDITEGTSIDNEIFIGMTNGYLRAVIKASASVVYDSGNISATVGTRYKMAMAYANNDVALYINGTQEDTSSSATIPNTDEITIGNRTDSKAMVVKESVNQALLFPTRLSNTQLAELTTL